MASKFVGGYVGGGLGQLSKIMVVGWDLGQLSYVLCIYWGIFQIPALVLYAKSAYWH